MRSRAPVFAALLGGVAISAATYVVAKHALASFGGLEVMLLRFATSAPLFGLMLAAQPAPRAPPRRLLPGIVALGLLGLPLNQGFFLSGLERSTPNHAGLLYALSPLLVFLFSLALRRERATWPKLAGLAIGFGGVAVVLAERGLVAEADVRAGDAVILGGVVSWSLYSVFGRTLAERHGGVRATCWAALAGSLASLPFAPLVVAPAHLAAASASAWLAIAFLSVATSFVSYLLWYFALARTEASRASAFTNLQPVATAALSWIVDGTPVTPGFAAGGALVLAGVFLAQRGS